MAKVMYNNIPYDILDAILVHKREYMIMSNPNDIRDIRFIEKFNDGTKDKYFLPPQSFKLENNPNCNIKRLEIHTIMNQVINILRRDINSGVLASTSDIKKEIDKVKSFFYTDLTLQSFMEDERNLNLDNYDKIVTYLTKYIQHQFPDNNKKEVIEESNDLSRPIKTNNGLNYDWLYSLDSTQLKQIASDKNRTSEELIYILDALDKKLKTDQAIEQYTIDNGHAKVKANTDTAAAFVETLLLSLITGSFALLLLLSLF